MNSKKIWLLGVVSVAAMVGSTACIIVDDSTGSGGSGGAGGDTTAATTDAAVSTGTGGACVSCAEYYTNGYMGTLCEDSATLDQALQQCLCGACTNECGAQCDSQDQACADCAQAAAGSECSAEASACANDT